MRISNSLRAVFASCMTLACTAQSASPLPTSRPILELQASGCGPNNALYSIENPSSSVTVNVVVCVDQTDPGRTHKRLIQNYTMTPKKKQTLGCDVENGIGQRFYVSWQWTNVEPFPSNVTDPEKVIILAHGPRGRDGKSAWYVVNAHHFKPVTVEGYYNGKYFNESIKGGDRRVMLGMSASEPRVTKVRYHSPYGNQCFGGTDSYPRVQGLSASPDVSGSSKTDPLGPRTGAPENPQ